MGLDSPDYTKSGPSGGLFFTRRHSSSRRRAKIRHVGQIAGDRIIEASERMGACESEIFSRAGRDHPNQLERPREIGFFAHAISAAQRPAQLRAVRRFLAPFE
jgi:hypothetical protein